MTPERYTVKPGSKDFVRLTLDRPLTASFALPGCSITDAQLRESGLSVPLSVVTHVLRMCPCYASYTISHASSIVTILNSANQEDHLFMAAFFACNAANVIVIALFAVAHGADLHLPFRTSPPL